MFIMYIYDLSFHLKIFIILNYAYHFLTVFHVTYFHDIPKKIILIITFLKFLITSKISKFVSVPYEIHNFILGSYRFITIYTFSLLLYFRTSFKILFYYSSISYYIFDELLKVLSVY